LLTLSRTVLLCRSSGFVLVIQPNSTSLCHSDEIVVCNGNIVLPRVHEVRNGQVTVDSISKFDSHINSVVTKALYTLPVSTGGVHGPCYCPWTRVLKMTPVSTAREHGCPK